MNRLKRFTEVSDIPDLDRALEECVQLKKDLYGASDYGKNKSVGLVFLNPSLRTRISMQRACENLGFHSVVINAGQGAWGWETAEGAVMNGAAAEHIKEAAKVMSQYCDILAIRCFPSLTDKEADVNDHILNQFIKHAEVPVISMESATRHPLQSFADMLTIKENWKEKRKPKIVLTWAPHIKPLAHSVANSFCEWVKEIDAEVVVTNPLGYDLNPEFTQGLAMTHRQDEALKNADFVYVKNWSSFADYGAMPEVQEDWMLTLEKLRPTRQAKVMHCLPVRRNVVISDEVLNSKQALIYEQAKNRMITAQWVLKNIG